MNDDLVSKRTSDFESIVSISGYELPEEVKKSIASLAMQSEYWRKEFEKETPEEYTYFREGPKDDNGNSVSLEYVKDSYTMRQLNKLYPGWEQEDMKYSFHPEVQTWVVAGYAIIPIITLQGIEKRKIWAVSGAQVKAKKNDPGMASQPEDMLKGAYTEWIKLVGRRLGIGNDIYEQSIPSKIKDYVEKLISLLSNNSKIRKTLSLIKKKNDYINFVRDLFTEKQVLEFERIIKTLEEQGLDETKKNILYDQFQMCNKKTAAQFITDIKTHNKIQ